MTVSIAIHSYKGGTGKTSISLNLSTLVAQEGKNTCLLDWDFSGPSLNEIFEINPEFYLNDLIEGRCAIEDVLVDVAPSIGVPGEFLVGFADPEAESIRAMTKKGREFQMKALRRVFALKRHLEEKSVELVIFDTSPGVSYSSLNAIIISDKVVIIMKPYKPDFGGTLNMLRGIHTELDKESYLLVNKVPIETIMSPEDKQDFTTKVQEYFADVVQVQLLGMIPCLCSVPQTGFQSKAEDIILALKKEYHPLVAALRDFLPKLRAQNL
ncbi:MAG: MinD/ParA family protein [Candidatus Hodarchaeota archaeon]